MRIPWWVCAVLSVLFYGLALAEAWHAGLPDDWHAWTAWTTGNRDGLVALTFYVFAGFTFGGGAYGRA